MAGPMSATKLEREVEKALWGKGRAKASKPSRLPEKSVQEQCIDWLGTLPGVSVWRQNTGGKSGHYTSKKTGITKGWFVRFGVPGQADTTGILRPHGIRIEIECKAEGKEPEGERGIKQLAWLQQIRESGGIAFWCNSLDSCVQQMRFEWVRRGWHWSKRWEV